MNKRRHHFVWQHYLSAWCTDGQLGCLRNESFFSTGTTAVAVEKDFYKLADLTPPELKLLSLMVQRIPAPMRSVQMGWLRMFTAPSVLESIFGGASAEADKLLTELRFNTEEEFHTKIENDAQSILAELRAGGRGFFDDRAAFQTFVFYLSLQLVRTQRVRDRLKMAFDGTRFPPGFGEIEPARIAGGTRMISATSLAASYIMQREHCSLMTIEAADGAEFITGDQPVVNIYARDSDGFVPPSKIRLYYPVSPTRALVLGDRRDDPMTASERADTTQVARYNSLIVSSAQHDLYGTSESVLRAARRIG